MWYLSVRNIFFFFLFNRKFLTETQRPRDIVEKSDSHVVIPMESKEEIQISYSTSVPMQEPWTSKVRSSNSLYWGSKVIKLVLHNQALNAFKLLLEMCHPFLGKKVKICIPMADKKAFHLIQCFFIAFSAFCLSPQLIFHILAIRKQCYSLLYQSCEGSMYLVEESMSLFFLIILEMSSSITFSLL